MTSDATNSSRPRVLRYIPAEEIGAPGDARVWFTGRGLEKTVDVRPCGDVVSVDKCPADVLIHVAAFQTLTLNLNIEDQHGDDAAPFRISVMVESPPRNPVPRRRMGLGRYSPSIELRFLGDAARLKPFTLEVKAERRRGEEEQARPIPSVSVDILNVEHELLTQIPLPAKSVSVNRCAIDDRSNTLIENLFLNNFAVYVKRQGSIHSVTLGEGTTAYAPTLTRAIVPKRATSSLICQQIQTLTLRDAATLRVGGGNGSIAIAKVEFGAQSHLRGLRPSVRFDKISDETNSLLLHVDTEADESFLRIGQSTISRTGRATITSRRFTACALAGTLRNVDIRGQLLMQLEPAGLLDSVSFENTTIAAKPGATIFNCTGLLAIYSIKEATVLGPSQREGGKLRIKLHKQSEHALKINLPPEEKPLERAVVRYVDVDKENDARLLASMRDASIFDPVVNWPERSSWQLITSWPYLKRNTRQLSPRENSTEELLGQACAEKSTLGSVRSIAEYRSMNARRSHAQSRLEWMLLSLYKLVGYGRRPASAAWTWLLIASVEVLWRLRDGVSAPNIDLLVKAGLSTYFPPIALVVKETPVTSIDVVLRILVSTALAFLLIALGRYGRISRKVD